MGLVVPTSAVAQQSQIAVTRYQVLFVGALIFYGLVRDREMAQTPSALRDQAKLEYPPRARILEPRKLLNNAVLRDSDATALQTMIQQYSVRLLLVDATDADVDDDNPAVLQLGTVAFTNPAATIAAVG